MSWNQYPGSGHHQPQQQQQGYGYAPPPPQWAQNPPPPQYANQQQQQQFYPPPPGGPGGQYAPPPGPPQGYQQQQSYNDGRSTTNSYGGGGEGYAPPTGAPPHHTFHQTAAGYVPGGGGYAPPSGPPPNRPPTQTQHYGPQFQGQNGQQNQPYFQYSQCTGRRKALCIGINYIGSSNALSGCINDAHNVQKFLIDRYGYKAEDIVMLTDDSRNARQIPTRQNMIQAMQWLVQGAQPNDALFFHYSGHGGQTKDLDGDEDDGYDEVIYPVDFKQNGHIVDDDLYVHFNVFFI